MASRQGWFAVGLMLRPLQLGLTLPSFLYLTTLTIFLFRPPDLDFYHADRTAFGRHARFKTICSMDFAGSYTERGQAPEEALVARNF